MIHKSLSLIKLSIILQLLSNQCLAQQNDKTDQNTGGDGGKMIGYIVGCLFGIIFLVCMILWIRINNICYCSSCLNTICPISCLADCCSVCDECKYKTDVNRDCDCCNCCYYLCCQMNPLNDCFACDDNTLYAKYLESVFYNKTVDTIPYDDFKKLYKIRLDLDKWDTQHYNETRLNITDKTPLLENTITIND